MKQEPTTQLHRSVTEFVVMKLHVGLHRTCQIEPTQVNGTHRVPMIKLQAMMMYREMGYHSMYF